MEYNFIDLLVRMPASNPPPVLWHYTNLDGFLGIIKSKSLFATEMAYLNDAMEFHQAADLLVESMFSDSDKGEWGAPPEARSYLMSALQEAAKTVCVTSFCADPDLLSQWRGYGRNQRGISLGFDSEDLNNLAKSHVFELVRCNYERREQQAILLDALGEISNRLKPLPADAIEREAHLAGVTQQLAHWLVFIAPMIKDPGFREENEYRLVGPFEHQELKHLDARRAGDMLASYFPLPIANDEIKCPLREIVVGPPAADFQKMADPINVLLNRYWPEAHGIKITSSKIPYRSNGQ